MDDRKKRVNVPCNLLSQEENEKLFDVLGIKCTTMATAVVQVFLTDMKTNHCHWIKKYCGVACCVRDCVRKSYFIQIFSVEKAMCVWEQEIYNLFVYNAPCPFFHTFEADNCMAGLNFADNEEASTFEAAIQRILQDRLQRKQEKKRHQPVQPSQAGVVVPTPRSKSESMPSLPVKEEKSSKKSRKKKITKDDIGQPTNFVHHQHVGWDPERGFEISTEDPALLGFFSLAGVSEKDLKDTDTRKFIYDFIDNHGGVEVAKQEAILRNQPPTPPVREAPPTPRSLPATRMAPRPPPLPPSYPPPPAVTKPPGTGAMRPALPAQSHVPPPPARTLPLQKMPESVAHVAPVPPPPPPPPPPLPINNCAPPPPPPPPPPPASCANGREVQPDSRSALLEEIRRGKTLVPVDVNGNAPNVCDRGALLSQIRQGVELKPVSDEPRSSSPTPLSHGLAEALARALQERSRAIHQTDESESGEEEDDNDDDEWED